MPDSKQTLSIVRTPVSARGSDARLSPNHLLSNHRGEALEPPVVSSRTMNGLAFDKLRPNERANS